MIDQQIALHFLHYIVNVYQTPLPLYATHLINPFFNSRISDNHDKGYRFQPIVKSLYLSMFLQCRISFKLTKTLCHLYNKYRRTKKCRTSANIIGTILQQMAKEKKQSERGFHRKHTKQLKRIKESQSDIDNIQNIERKQ